MPTNLQTENAIPIACDMSALTPDARVQHERVSRDLFARVDEVRDLPDGYAFRLLAEHGTLHSAAAWIANERLCCPFFTFDLRLEPQSATLWLSLTGSKDVKAFIPFEFSAVLAPALTAAFTSA